MKKFFVLFALLLSVAVLKAQDDDFEGFSFDTEPLRSEKSPYFAVGAGYQYSFLFLNYDDLNKYAKNIDLDDFDGIFYVGGIHGFTGLVIVPNLRLGFFGISGSKITEKDISAYGSETEKRASELNIAMNGFSLDYGIVPFKALAILPGVNFGWGRLEIESYQSQPTKNWADIGLDNNKMHRIENSFMFVQPQINIEYAVTNFAMLRLNASYNITFDNPLSDKKWVYNNHTELSNVPSGINSKGFSAQIGLYLGLFNY